jgi:hypothetical protein
VILLDASGSITPKQADAIQTSAKPSFPHQGHRPVIAAVSDQVEIIPSLDDYQPIPDAVAACRAVDWVVDRAAAALMPRRASIVHRSQRAPSCRALALVVGLSGSPALPP